LQRRLRTLHEVESGSVAPAEEADRDAQAADDERRRLVQRFLETPHIGLHCRRASLETLATLAPQDEEST